MIAIILVWSSYFLSDLFDRFGLGAVSRSFEIFSMNWLGIIFLISTCLLIADLITLFGLLFKRYLEYLRATAFAAGIILSILALYQGHRIAVVRDYEIRIPDLPTQYDGLKLAVVSDLHISASIDENWLRQRVDRVNALEPDAILLLGDIFEGDSRSERGKNMMIILGGLSAPLGVWSIAGNHESHGELDSTVRFFADAGIHMLRNQYCDLAPGIVLAGVEERHDRYRSQLTTGRIRNVLSGVPDSCVVILLSHRPLGSEEAAAAGADLMLCGHTHGGQIWPFNYISGLANPLMAGEYEINGMPVIVSRGAGTWGPRMRLWRPGEILRIVLRSG